MDRTAFSAMLEAISGGGMAGAALAIPGNAAAFIVILSRVGARENPGSAEDDPRLR